MSKLTRAEVLATGKFTVDAVNQMEAMGLLKKEPKPKTPLVSIVRYTTKSTEKTNVYCRLAPGGSEWGATLIPLNAGNELKAEGHKRLIEIANAIGDLVDSPVVLDHGKK